MSAEAWENYSTERPAQVEAEPTPADDDSGPLYVDVAAMLEDRLPEPPQPVHMARQDGQRLYYAAKVNVLYGDPECGKTWIAYAALVEALNAGLRVLIIDVDHNGAAEILHRLRLLGADPEALKDPSRFRLAEPEDREALMAVVADCTRGTKGQPSWKPDLVVVDSIGELMPMMGLNSNSPDDYTTAHRATLGALAKAGACVIGIDHMSKGPTSRQHGQGGAGAKRRAVNGLSVRVTLAEPLAPGAIGRAHLRIDKDRPGALRAVCPGRKNQPLGNFHLDSTDPRISRWWVTTPTEGDVAAVTDAESASDHGTQPPSRRSAEGWQVSDADLAALDGLAGSLNQSPSVRVAQKHLEWASDRATATVRTWKQMQMGDDQ